MHGRNQNPLRHKLPSENQHNPLQRYSYHLWRYLRTQGDLALYGGSEMEQYEDGYGKLSHHLGDYIDPVFGLLYMVYEKTQDLLKEFAIF